jgi:hypothetical protein
MTAKLSWGVVRNWFFPVDVDRGFVSKSPEDGHVFLIRFPSMFSPPILRHILKRVSPSFHEFRRGIVTKADVDQARNYCLNQLRYGL